MKKYLLLLMVALGSFIFVFGDDTMIIGREEGDGLLIYPRQIEEGPDGNIYVYDQADAFIKVYFPEGKYLRKIGGKGQGPGEIQRVEGVSIGFTPDEKLFFTEYFGGHPWISLMELSGEFNRAIKLDIKEFFGIDEAISLSDGNFLAQISLIGMPEKRKDFFLHSSLQELVLFDSKGSIVSKINRTNYFTRISFLDAGADLGLPFTPVFAWCPFRENTIIFSEGLSTKLKVYDFEGKLIKEIDTPLSKPEKVKKSDLDEWRERRKRTIRDKTWYSRFGKVIEKYKKSIYDKRPNLGGISLTPDGNILIAGITYFWLLDEKGKTLAKISLDGFELSISRNFVFYKTLDDEENILVHCLKRKGTEKEDLLRIK